jgi:hypothetical protein
MVKDGGVKKVAVAAPAPEEATPTGLTATPTLTVQLLAPEAREKCYKKTVGEEATFLEIAKDYFNQFKEVPAQKHWICFKSYFDQKRGSVMSHAHTPLFFSIFRWVRCCTRVISLAWRFHLVRSCLVVYVYYTTCVFCLRPGWLRQICCVHIVAATCTW